MADARLVPSVPEAAVTPAATALLPVTAAEDAHLATVSTVFHLSSPGVVAAAADDEDEDDDDDDASAGVVAAPPHSLTGAAAAPAAAPPAVTEAEPMPDTLAVLADAALLTPAAASAATASCGGLPVGLGADAASACAPDDAASALPLLPLALLGDATYGLIFSAALQRMG